MTFYTTYNGTVIILSLFTELNDKPILKGACLDVFRTIIMTMMRHSEEEGEPGDDSFNRDKLEETVEDMVSDHMADDWKEAKQITLEYGEQNALNLFNERSCESLTDLVREYEGNRFEILSYHIMMEQFERTYESRIWEDVMTHFQQFREGNEYTTLSIQYE
jgi:hypothetical protein